MTTMNKSVSLFTHCVFDPQANHWISVVLILCLMYFGCSDDPEVDTAVVEKRQMDGWTAYAKGDFSAALLHFERVIELDATFADAHNGLGWTHLSTSHAPATAPDILVKAQRAFETAIRSDASNADAWIGLANTLFLRRESASDFEIALRAIDNALQGDQRTLFRHDYQSAADLYALGAACYYYLGQTNLARAMIERALQIEPSNTTALSLQHLLIDR
jgi:tetratricopeptide (TPR) repeat protein